MKEGYRVKQKVECLELDSKDAFLYCEARVSGWREKLGRDVRFSRRMNEGVGLVGD